MFRIIDELDTLIRTFNHDKIEFALCGAIAMAIHGYPRAAMDIDLLVEEQVLDQIQRIAEENGFVSLELGALIDAGIRRRSKITGGVILGLDLLLVGDETKDVWESKKQVMFRGHPMSVVSLKGLIKLKRLSGRPQDLADIYRMENEEVCKSRDVDSRLHQVDQLHALSVELLKAGKTHYERLVAENRADERELARFRRYLV